MRRTRFGPLMIAVLGMGVVAACGGSSAGDDPSGDAASGGGASSDPDATLTVWVDGTRATNVEAFQAVNPDVSVDVVTIPQDSGYTGQQILLANESDGDKPDVVFLADSGEIAALAAPPYDFAAPLDDLVPADVREQFAPSTLENCTFDDQVYCLQNDIAQTVLWYNPVLMEEFGYDVPTTFEEYAEIGARLAEEHPGYIIGATGDNGALPIYYQSSGCPLTEVTAADTVTIDTADERCTRVNNILQPLIDNGTVSSSSFFDPDVTELGTTNKILMLPHASWFGAFVYKTTYLTPDGELAAAPMPTWPGETERFSGAVGGGVYAINRDSDNLQGAADLITFLTTDVDLQTTQPTYPAFIPAAESWSTAQAEDPLYAESPIPAFQEQAALINPVWKFTRYNSDLTNGWNDVVVPGIKEGDRLSDLMTEYGEILTEAASDTGYTVE